MDGEAGQIREVWLWDLRQDLFLLSVESHSSPPTVLDDGFCFEWFLFRKTTMM